MVSLSKDKSKDYVWGKRDNKKKIIGIIALVVVTVAVALGYIIFGLDWDTGSEVNVYDGKPDTLVRRAIDGVMVPADQANYFPVAIMIENLVVSRPPSGLAQANIVYEALVEGGITRFMALYAGPLTISEVGPVRSARPYYLDWALEYGALYFHAGGSPQALQYIKTDEVFDLNQFYNAQYFRRDSKRQAPHNLYTSGENIAYALRDKNAPDAGVYERWQFADDVPLADRPTEAKSIIIDYSSMSYQVEYRYDREQNDYVRYLAGEVHTDKDGAEIRAKNVIVQKVKTTLADESRLAMQTVGEGEALIFHDGTATAGRWEKKNKKSRTYFYDDQGRKVTLTAGTTWVSVVPTDRTIEYN